jgi:hypothetical protein
MFTVFSQQLMFITTIAICVVPSVSAHTFYVDTEHPNASDENNGTESSPWKTLGRACKQADNGDIVLVKAGVYYETLRPIRDGVTFAAYGNDSVILSAPIHIFPSNALQLCKQHDSCFTFTSPVDDPLLIVDGKAAMRVSDAKGFIQRPELKTPRYYTQDGLIHLFMQGSNQPNKLDISSKRI